MNVLVIHSELVGRKRNWSDGDLFVRDLDVRHGWRYAESHNWDIVMVRVPKKRLDKNWIMCLETHSEHILWMAE